MIPAAKDVDSVIAVMPLSVLTKTAAQHGHPQILAQSNPDAGNGERRETNNKKVLASVSVSQLTPQRSKNSYNISVATCICAKCHIPSVRTRADSCGTFNKCIFTMHMQLTMIPEYLADAAGV